MMKNIKNTISKIVLGVVILLTTSVVAHAGIGITPADIVNENLKPGASFTTEFKLSRSGNLNEISIVVEPDYGPISSWFTVKPGKVMTFPQGQRIMYFQISVNVPETAEYKDYKGAIHVTALPDDADVKGVMITQGLQLNAQLKLTEEDIEKLSITAIKTENVIKGSPVKIDITAKNEGNVDASPVAKVKVMDLQQNLIEEHDISNLGVVKSNETKTITGQFLSNLEIGEYFLEVEVFLDSQSLRKERLVLSVTEDKPVVATTDDDSKDQKSSIQSLLGDNQEYILWIVAACVGGVIIYFLIDKLWNNKPVEEKEKPASVALGSKKSTREILSISFGFLIFLGLFSASLSDAKVVETKVNDSNKDVQGAQDTTVVSEPTFSVLPAQETDTTYPVFSRPDKNSSVIYDAKDGETFDVMESDNGWYKVSLPDGSIGWIPEDLIKSKVTEQAQQ